VQDAGWHQFIEFGNRTLTFVLLAVAIWVVWAARRDAADRPDLRRLAWAQPAGIVAQAVLGGITVLTGLSPLWVASHFLLSMVVLAAAVVLHDRVSGAPPADDHSALRRLTVAMTVVAPVVLVLGTLVTASGPHAGDPGTHRLPIDIRTIAFLHADAVWLLVGLTVATLVAAWSLGSRRVTRAVGIVLVVEFLQGGIGYTQYALGIPPELVSLHIVGAAVLWVVVLRARLATTTPVDRRVAASEPAAPAVTSATA
jgi:cytochrome c oxidase assembly protein subunit 15